MRHVNCKVVLTGACRYIADSGYGVGDMHYNILFAGVGGQGILTIAQAISRAAMLRGWNVKQSEVHGMSQRGGAVQAHLRISDRAIHSDLIPLGQADMLLAVEPLEVLRYVEYLSEGGVIVCSSVPFVNIGDYPPIEEVLERIAKIGDHVLMDSKQLAQAAGSVRAENIVMLGAASAYLDFSAGELEEVVAKAFAAKGDRVVEANRRAFRLGRAAATTYRDGLRRGATSRSLRAWLKAQSPERLLAGDALNDGGFIDAVPDELSAAEEEAIVQVLRQAQAAERTQLHEHEVYAIVGLTGAITPPRHRFVTTGETLTADDLAVFRGNRVVLKIVSPTVVHKSDAGGIAFVHKEAAVVQREMTRLTERHTWAGAHVNGILVVEFIEQAGKGLGSELFVGVRQSRELGAVIAAGLGGVDTEYLAATMQRGAAVARASALNTTADEFFDLFRATAAYQLLSGQVRGHERIVSDGELRRCFRTFLAIARRFCVAGVDGTCLDELEVNPFAFVHQRMVPLDGRGRLGTPIHALADRPIENIQRLLEPRSVAVLGVSGKRENFGRIILNNIKASGFPTERLYVIKEGADSIDGVCCVASLRDLPECVDLLVAATSADRAPEVVGDVIGSGESEAPRCLSVILIPGALGEKHGTEGVERSIRSAIAASRSRPDAGPVFLGGNCMGVRSRPGRYDTFFIPESKLDPRRDARPKRAALISQSGAFIITRLSNLEFLDPALAISVGNQVDLTVGDLMQAVAGRDDIDCVGVYAEGFNDLDGAKFLCAVEAAVAAGKIVVFYKAGRTSAGRSAAQGHTASVAGDYDVCDAAVARAGAVVTDTFKEFEQLIELATDLHDKRVRGNRLGVVSNAGYEAVGAADTVRGSRYRVEMPELSAASGERLTAVLKEHRLDGLVNARNPLDLTPMADDAAYEECVRVLLDAEEIDALIVGCVPMTPQLLTTPAEIGREGSIAKRLARVFHETDKPMVVVVDCSKPYNDFARAVLAEGVPVFRSADQAVRSLGRYLGHRTRWLPQVGSQNTNLSRASDVPEKAVANVS